MSNQLDIQIALDTAVQTEFALAPAIPVVFGNQSDDVLSKGTATYLGQKVLFIRGALVGVGETAKRQRGLLQFFIHVRKGVGDRDRSLIIDRIDSVFVAKYIGGATLSEWSLIASSEVGGWSVTGLQIPFYFDKPRG